MADTEIPEDISTPSHENFLQKDSVLILRHAISKTLADQLITKITQNLLPELQQVYPDTLVNPLFNKFGNLIAVDFFISLSDDQKLGIRTKINAYVQEILAKMDLSGDAPQIGNGGRRTKMQEPLSFTELLGTFRVRLTRIHVPVLVCIITATLLAWIAKYPGQVDINAAIFPNESTGGEILLNGLIPVLMSAIFITIIYFLVKKFGMKAFKIIMGIIVMFYSWYGLAMFISIFYSIFWDLWGPNYGLMLNIFYFVLMGGSFIFFIVVGIQFFRNRLTVRQRNAIVLTYSILMGSIFGMILPTWTTMVFAVFLSIWDLITVFKGPLGKLGTMIQENQQRAREEVQIKVNSGEMGIDEAKRLPQFISGQLEEEAEDESGGARAIDYKSLEIELGSGDLILYSALVANVYTTSLNIWVTIMVFAGVIAGAAMTLFLLITKRKMLPALPFSMFFGVIMYLLGYLIFLR